MRGERRVKNNRDVQHHLDRVENASNEWEYFGAIWREIPSEGVDGNNMDPAGKPTIWGRFAIREEGSFVQ